MTSTTDLIKNTSDRFFIDSNLLVYMCDSSEPQKQPLAEELIASLARNRNGALSAQVLGEFFSIVTRRIPRPLTVDEATAVMDSVSPLPVMPIEPAMVRRAIATHSRYGTSYWDSLIIAAAERAGCTSILSEDMNPGQPTTALLSSTPFPNHL